MSDDLVKRLRTDADTWPGFLREDLVRQAATEIERLRGFLDAICLCRWCHKPDSACQCTHPDTSSWMTPQETVDYYLAEIERLRAALGEVLDGVQSSITSKDLEAVVEFGLSVLNKE